MVEKQQLFYRASADAPSETEPTRYEERAATNLPVRLIMRLTAKSGDMIPALLTNLSASGLLVLVDVRFSPLLPPVCGTSFEVEFFFDDVEVRKADVTIERIEKRKDHQLALGCSFVGLSDEMRIAIRHKVAARLAARNY